MRPRELSTKSSAYGKHLRRKPGCGSFSVLLLSLLQEIFGFFISELSDELTGTRAKMSLTGPSLPWQRLNDPLRYERSVMWPNFCTSRSIEVSYVATV